MARNGFGKYLPAEQTEAQKRSHPSHRRGFGQYADGTHDAAALKRAQLAEQRRARIRGAIAQGECGFDFDGKPIDPLANQPELIEQEWSDEFGGDAA